MIEDERSAQEWFGQLPEWDELAHERMIQLVGLLSDENLRQNLVSRSSLPSVWQRHLADSAQLLRFVPRETSSWLDLGTGAGFPGLVIAILQPDLPFALVESRRRRSDWLNRAVEALALKRVRVLGQPLEQLDTEKFDAISARAFAPLDRLLDIAHRFSTKDTLWLLPKGRSGAQELKALKGWRHRFHVEQSLTDAEASVIVGTLVGQDGLG